MDEYVNITLSIRSLCRYLVVGVFVAKVWQDVVSRDQLYKNEALDTSPTMNECYETMMFITAGLI